MKLALAQWLVFALTGGLFYLIGLTVFHVRNFGFFAGSMLVIAAAMVAAVIALERRKSRSEENDGNA